MIATTSKIIICILLGWGVFAPQFVFAQSFPVFQEDLKVASINQDRLFRESQYGLAILAELDATSAELAADNRNIEEALRAEELELTELRKTETPEAFRARAVAFDAKVKRTRAQQEQKLTDIRQSLEQARTDFFAQVAPVLEQLMREKGLVFILDSKAILVSLSDGDITDEAIALANELIQP